MGKPKGPKMYRAPIPLREFESLIAEQGCTYESTSKGHYKILDEYGCTVSTFALSHGKNTKGNEVPPIYVKNFLKAVKD